jgi:hypothetical protein
MISSIAVLSMMVVWSLWGRNGFVISPEVARPPTSGETHEEGLVRQLNQINEDFSLEFWRRYRELRAKMESEVLVPDGAEHKELIQMTDQLELRQADRIGLLVELAKIRKTSLTEVMKHSDVTAHFHG